MTNWTVTEGYHAGVDYNYEYHAELNPLRLNLALLNVDLVAPVTSTACELGFGQGLAMNLHAAASTTQWFGTDFNQPMLFLQKNLHRRPAPLRVSSTNRSPNFAVALTCLILTLSACTVSLAGSPTRTAAP